MYIVTVRFIHKIRLIHPADRRLKSLLLEHEQRSQTRSHTLAQPYTCADMDQEWQVYHMNRLVAKLLAEPG